MTAFLPLRRTISFAAAAIGLLGLAGCSAVPEGFTRAQWAVMSPSARKQVLRQESLASEPMHRALARDAATENGFIR